MKTEVYKSTCSKWKLISLIWKPSSSCLNSGNWQFTCLTHFTLGFQYFQKTWYNQRNNWVWNISLAWSSCMYCAIKPKEKIDCMMRASRTSRRNSQHNNMMIRNNYINLLNWEISLRKKRGKKKENCKKRNSWYENIFGFGRSNTQVVKSISK